MVILLQINYNEDHSEKILPLGILSVGSALKKHGIDVELWNITEKEIKSTARKNCRRKARICWYVSYDWHTNHA